MKILLVYPEMADTFYSLKYVMRILGKKASFPPVGLLTVAAMLPNDWELKLIDLNVQPLSDEHIRWSDMVFISAMNTQAQSAFNIIEHCKSVGATIVAGGPLFTHEHHRFEHVDHFVLNEAEITLPLFLEDFKNNELKRIYSTIEFADVHQTPIPRWDLINTKDYAYSIVQYSRGCPYLCDFCDVTVLFGRRPRVKTPAQIIGELEAILKHGYPGAILFADDNLIGNRVSLKNELLPELIEWRAKNPYAPGFETQVTINLADDDEMIHLLKEAGFGKLFIGIETMEEEALFQMNKKQNTRRNLLNSVYKLEEKGFIIAGGFILGLDSDSPGIFQSMIEFIEESGIVLVIINLLKAPVGTELYEKMKTQNRLITDLDFDERRSNIIHKMDKNVLSDGYKKVIAGVTSSESIYKRAITYFEKRKPLKVRTKLQQRIGLEEMVIFLRVLFLLGVKDGNRKILWRLTWWLFRNKKLHFFDHAMLFAAVLYQYTMMGKNT